MTRSASRRGMTSVATSMLALALAACGGSGGSGGTGSANTAPAFSSAATGTVAENTTGVAYQASASDAQGDAVTYTISGGADAAAFAIASGGALSFVAAPNYDLPTDADGDNVYHVTLQASDGKASSTLGVAITVTNEREGIRVERIATGLADPVGIASLGVDGNVAVALRANAIMRIDGRTGAQSTYYSFFPHITSPISAVSLLGIARARSEGSRESIFVLGTQFGRAWVACLSCTYFSLADLVPDSQAANLAIGKGADGNAYVAIGDPDGTSAQDASSPLGKLVRFVPFPSSYDPYSGASVPMDYYTRTVAGSGLRAPAGVAALPDGRMIVSDRGGTDFDELSLTADLGAPNFGWPYFEGTKEKRAGGAGLAGLVTPSLVVPLGTEPRQSRGIVGGVAYTGSIPGIANHYVFSDKGGQIWSIPLARLSGTGTLQASALELRSEDFMPDAGTIDRPVGMAIDADGTLYILDGDGELFRVVPTGTVKIDVTTPPAS